MALGNKAWFLLQDPLGPGGEGLSSYAGDPGLPVPDWEKWPGGNWPATELWEFANGKFTQATDVLGAGDEKQTNLRRTLYSPFLAGGQLYVLHFDARRVAFAEKKGLCHVVRIDDSLRGAQGRLPQSAVALFSDDFLDAPAVSPDGAFVAFRAFSNKTWTLRVYRLSDWSLVAQSTSATWARPIWAGGGTLACIAYEAAARPAAEAENPVPAKGQLVRLDLVATELKATNLLGGSFPPDSFVRHLSYDSTRKRIVIARQVITGSTNEIVVEERNLEIDATPFEIARFDHFRGIAVDGSTVLVSGVRDRSADDPKKIDRRIVMAALKTLSPVPESGSKDEVVAAARRELSPDGRGGLQDIGSGVGVILEPVLNPLQADSKNQPQHLHTLMALNWRHCDSLRNPRVIQYLSAMARRFKQIEDFESVLGGRSYRFGIQSTVMGFDLDIKVSDAAIKNKTGRYVELYDGSTKSRKGAGRIRVEDNIGGNWMVYGLSGDGTEAGDSIFDNSAVNAGGLNATPATRSGMYQKLLGQIESRKLLLLTGLERSPEKGGLSFSSRGFWRDPITGTVRRIWSFTRKDANGKLDNASMGFIADAPYVSGEMQNAHPLLVAAVVFGMGQGNVNSSILAFDYTSYVELPDLSGYNGPSMLLPKVVRAYARDDKNELVEQFSATLLTEFPHEPGHVLGGRVWCGYNVRGASQDKNFTELMTGLKFPKPK